MFIYVGYNTSIIKFPRMATNHRGMTSIGGADMLSISGIYEIRNTQNGHRYIGSAVNIRGRWAEHKRDLYANNHHSKHLQNAWNLYGADSFRFSVIEYCDRDSLVRQENFWLYESSFPEYNIARDAKSPMLNRKHSDETKKKQGSAHKGKNVSDDTKRKQSLAHTGYVTSDETKRKLSAALMGVLAGVKNGMFGKRGAAHHNARPVNQYSLSGEFIAHHEGVLDAARAVGIGGSFSNISACCNGRRPHAGGYIWRYADE